MATTLATARLVLLVALVAGSTSCGGAWELSGLRMPTAARAVQAAAERFVEEEVAAPVIHALRPLVGSAGDLGWRGGVPCDSWRLAVETNNKRDWRTVPARCERYVGNYMLGGHYRRDSRVVIDEAVAYAEGLQLAGNGKEVWVFDIDETALSNLPYYASNGFGTKPYDATSFNAYVFAGSAPVLPETQRLYNKLISLGITPVFLTGRRENQRAITVANLRRVGYSGWMKLLLKPVGYNGTAIGFKSDERQKLQDAGYVIVGNIGDQWSDILGAPEGVRTFKLPDPLYVGHYMLGGHYRRDSRVVVNEAVAYAEGLKLGGKGKEVWVFDIDETSLSNLPYYATHGFGTKPYNATSFNAYVLEGSAPVLPETQRLYNKLIALGIKPVFLTGRTEDQRAITVANLRRQGYSGWMKLLLKPVGFKASAIGFKSGERQKLQDAGYVIVGNIGDQWSDILGAPEGARTFKLPDPIYYIG
ncbi:uncharacterized protein [Setaria viridis]|uniref:uncharacterized protein n=1 Tax=Setaria viridis TaxID=4556 RepID=UPI001493809D|nr:uncharacterized protein LOC117850194 [Setaria viridis]